MPEYMDSLQNVIQSLSGLISNAGIDEESKLSLNQVLSAVTGAAKTEATIGSRVELANAAMEQKTRLAEVQDATKRFIQADKSQQAVELAKLKESVERFKQSTGVEKQRVGIAGELDKLRVRAEEGRRTEAFKERSKTNEPVRTAISARRVAGVERGGIVELVRMAQSAELGSPEQIVALEALQASQTPGAKQLSEKTRMSVVAQLLNPEIANLGPEAKQAATAKVEARLSALAPDELQELVRMDNDIRTLTPEVKKLGGTQAHLVERAKAGSAAEYLSELQTTRGGRNMKRGLIGGAAAIILPLLAMSMFGKGKKGESQSEIPPMLQMQLAAQAQQMQQGSDQSDGRALLNLQRAMNIIKTLQGFSGLQGGQAPATAGLL